MSLLRGKLSDGTYLVWHAGENQHKNHWHVAPDGTLLSVKEGGDHKYKRSDIRKRIAEVAGFDWDYGWRQIGLGFESNSKQ